MGGDVSRYGWRCRGPGPRADDGAPLLADAELFFELDDETSCEDGESNVSAHAVQSAATGVAAQQGDRLSTGAPVSPPGSAAVLPRKKQQQQLASSFPATDLFWRLDSHASHTARLAKRTDSSRTATGADAVTWRRRADPVVSPPVVVPYFGWRCRGPGPRAEDGAPLLADAELFFELDDVESAEDSGRGETGGVTGMQKKEEAGCEEEGAESGGKTAQPGRVGKRRLRRRPSGSRLFPLRMPKHAMKPIPAVNWHRRASRAAGALRRPEPDTPRPIG